MVRRIGKKLVNNLSLKILAVFFAFGLWLVVLNIDDPIVTRTRTISVSLKNQSYLSTINKYSDILKENNTITFTYSAKRTTADALSNADFSAVADFQKMEYQTDGEAYRVPVSISVLRYTNNITVESKQIYLELNLEDLSRKQFQIKTEVVGAVADGYALGSVEIGSANVVQVSGPQSVVSQIASVYAMINVEGMSTNITDNVTPVFYDENGDVIDTGKLSMSVSSVNVKAEILNTKDVPLSFQTTGSLNEKYALGEIGSVPQTVRIKGEAAVLNKIDKIAVPAEVINLDGVTESFAKTIDISSYLPANVSLVIASEAKVEVQVAIEKVEKRTYQVPVANFTAEGLDENMQAVFESDFVSVEVMARVRYLDLIDAYTMTGNFDLSEKTVGEYSLIPKMDLNQELYSCTVSPINVYVTGESVEDLEGENE